jgi:5-(carboxyamino)imidazole ribonucleotide synthase
MTDWKVHLYGKKEPKLKRKMGHVTILRDDVSAALSEIEESSIWRTAKELIGG